MDIKKSPWACIFNSGGCNGCVLEVLTLTTPRYDIERFGAMIRPSARQADILLVTGPVTEQSRKRLKTVYDQMAKTKKVIAIGGCAITGEVFKDSYNIRTTVDKTIPVDIYVPGCPPRPEAIIDAILKVIGGKDGKKNKTK